jgi:hypothetical protein
MLQLERRRIRQTSVDDCPAGHGCTPLLEVGVGLASGRQTVRPQTIAPNPGADRAIRGHTRADMSSLWELPEEGMNLPIAGSGKIFLCASSPRCGYGRL